MIGDTYFHEQSGQTGEVDAVSTLLDGSGVARIDDHWFYQADMVPAEIAF